jgi:glutathione S-transferase
MHPPEKIHQPWIDHNESQARSGLQWLAAITPSPWLGGTRLTQADITTIAMYDFTRIVNAPLIPEGRYPRLDALAAECLELPAFSETKPVSEADQSNPSLQNISS